MCTCKLIVLVHSAHFPSISPHPLLFKKHLRTKKDALKHEYSHQPDGDEHPEESDNPMTQELLPPPPPPPSPAAPSLNTHTQTHSSSGEEISLRKWGFEKMEGRRSYCPVQRPCCNLVFGLGVAASAESHWGCWESKWRQSKHDHGNVGLSHSCHKMWHYLDDVLWKHATKF